MQGCGLFTLECACDTGMLIGYSDGSCAGLGYDQYMYVKWVLTCCSHINMVYVLTANTQKHVECVPNSSCTFINSLQPAISLYDSLND